MTRDPRPIAPILTAARDEAALAGHGYVGVEHLLLTLARPQLPSSGSAARLLAAHGLSLESARAVVRRVVEAGEGDGPRWDAAALLGTLGVDLTEVRRHVEIQFGPDAIHRLYASPVGWNLRPRGPLCDPPITPQLKKALSTALGRCWDSGPTQLTDRLLLAALDAGSNGLARVLDELGIPTAGLRAAVAEQLRLTD